MYIVCNVFMYVVIYGIVCVLDDVECEYGFFSVLIFCFLCYLSEEDVFDMFEVVLFYI